MRTHVFTSIVANYIPKARVLARSIRKQHPDVSLHLFISDEVPAGFKPDQEPFDRVWTLSDLGLPDIGRWVFQHSIVEVSTGIKGWALQKLLEQKDCSE